VKLLRGSPRMLRSVDSFGDDRPTLTVEALGLGISSRKLSAMGMGSLLVLH
jgi:hypothetical protein